MQKSNLTMVASFLAISAGCADDPGPSRNNRGEDTSQRSVFGADAGAAGACTLTCEGEVYACESTSEVGCRAGAFAQVPRCLYELEWAEGAQCGGEPDEPLARRVACDTPSTQCTGYGLKGHVNYTMNPCAAVLCAEPTEKDAQAQLQYSLACEAAGGAVTECNCGLAVCSVQAGATPLSESQTRRRDLATKYPNIAAGSTEPENKKVLCPFLRMLTRAGLFDAEAKQSRLTVGILKIARAAREFACSFAACGSVAGLASQNQMISGTTKLGAVNLESLHTAGFLSHDCGLTFAKGGTEVDDGVRAQTLKSLRGRADEKGRLTLDDLKAVKLAICQAQNVSSTSSGNIEVGLIYTFLGGNERGFVDYADVERLLFAELPKTIGAPGFPSQTE